MIWLRKNINYRIFQTKYFTDEEIKMSIKEKENHIIGFRREPRSKTRLPGGSAASDSEFAVGILDAKLLSKGQNTSELPWHLKSLITGR